MNRLAHRSITIALGLGLLGSLACSNAPVRDDPPDEETGGASGDKTGGSSGGGRGGTGGRTATGGSGPATGGRGADSSGGTGGSATGGADGSGGTGGSAKQDAGPTTPDAPAAVDAPKSDMGSPTAAKNCNSPDLVWKSAQKTYYTSYPAKGSEECIKYSGCKYEGQFFACGDAKNVKSKAWVMAHNIVAMFPLGNYGLHDLCLKAGGKTIVVTVLDTCGDNDCDGCCTDNKGSADALIDLESFTNQRFGVGDGRIQWADLGPTTGDGCN